MEFVLGLDVKMKFVVIWILVEVRVYRGVAYFEAGKAAEIFEDGSVDFTIIAEVATAAEVVVVVVVVVVVAVATVAAIGVIFVVDVVVVDGAGGF